ncbi:NAD-dependent epimerase/dehydratase family protein [Streptomyces sp. NPDC058457]|uniref:NAD-dependent epimerase/dehydratase family protein n=1 Tax=Streptomyces sp. NPDC058457 TaxID=3346507 RepID=UPI00364B2530
MSESKISLVTGATGHVGFTLVQYLLAQGETVRAGVRDTGARSDRLRALDVELVRAELMDRASLVAAMRGVDIVYSVAAAFRVWAKDPENEIVRVNLDGTRHLVEAALEAGVHRIVYVSSMTTVDASVRPFSADTWNPLNINPYEYSKTQAEKLARQLVDGTDIEFVSVLPSAITGPGFSTPTGSVELFTTILAGKFTVDPGLHLLLIDARDVAKACHLAATRGRDMGRYLVSNTTPVSTTEMVKTAQQMFPELGLKTPRTLSPAVLKPMARAATWVSRLTRRPPLMRPEIIQIYAGAPHLRADTASTTRDLGLQPIDNEQTVRDSFRWAKDHF